MVQELQARLVESQAAEAALPAEVDDLHRQLQGDFARLQAREAGAACVPVFLCRVGRRMQLRWTRLTFTTA